MPDEAAPGMCRSGARAKRKIDDARDRCDSCPGRFRSGGRPSRGLGGIIDGQKVDTMNEGATF